MTIPLWFKRDIHLGDIGPDVRIVRRKLGFVDQGPYDRSVSRMVMGLAKKKNVETSGEVNADVAQAIGPAADETLTPEWYERDLEMWCHEGDDVRQLNSILGCPRDNRFTPETEQAVRRFQSAHDIFPDGRVTADLAKLIGSAN